MAALVRKVETNGPRSPELYTALDLMSLGHLICGFNESTARKMRISSFMTASAALSYLFNCSRDVLEHFARMAVKTHVFGAPRNWRSTTVIIPNCHYSYSNSVQQLLIQTSVLEYKYS